MQAARGASLNPSDEDQTPDSPPDPDVPPRSRLIVLFAAVAASLYALDVLGKVWAVRQLTPGETVDLQLRRGGSLVDVKATTRDSDGRATIGVFLGREFDFPVDVEIHAGDVGGPSAGTMFALGIYDTLTPGAMTGGQKIAGTGTIDSGGAVGPIGGIRQKLVGARDGGADWFLAPADNCDEVAGQACVAGKCVVKPCDEDAGVEVPR